MAGIIPPSGKALTFNPPLPLRAGTPPEWAVAALQDPGALLSDHAHNEKKAALTALSLTAAFPGSDRIPLLLAKLAEDELNHFRRVLEALQRYGWPIRPDQGNAYAQALLSHCRGGERLLDRLLVSALIEARSSERLFLLEQASEYHPELGAREWMAFLAELERCEAGHALTYLRIAEERFGNAVPARLERWLDIEAEVIRGLPWRSVVH